MVALQQRDSVTRALLAERMSGKPPRYSREALYDSAKYGMI
jgi:hypothetical protein